MTTQTTTKSIIVCDPHTGKLYRRRPKSAYLSYVAMLTAAGQYAPAYKIAAAKAHRAHDDAAETAALYTQYAADAYYVINYLNARQPSDLLTNLHNGLAADSTARNTPAIRDAMNDCEQAYNTAQQVVLDHVENATKYNRIAHSIRRTDDERAAAADMADAEYTAADIARTARDLSKGTLQDTAAALSTTLSIAADVVQVIAAADHEPPTETDWTTAQASLDRLLYAAAHHDSPAAFEALNAGHAAAVFIRHSPDSVLLAAAQRAHRRAAARAYIRSQRSPSALDGTSTSYRPATDADRQAWAADGHQTGAAYTVSTKGGTKSLVYRTATKTSPAGWYWMYKTHTYRQAYSLEQLTSRTDKDGHTSTDNRIIVTSNIYANSQSALEEIEELTARASLTPRQRLWVSAFCSRKAITAEGQARLDYFAAAGKKATEKGAAAAGYAARKDYAFDRLGIKTTTNRTTFFSRLKTALATARTSEEHTCITYVEYMTQDFAYWQHLQQDGCRGYTPDGTPRVDLISWIDSTSSPNAAPVVTWIDHDTATANKARAAAGAAANLAASHIDNTTPAALAAAAAAEKVYKDKHTRAAAEKAARAAAQAAADKAAAIKAAARRLDVATLHTTYQMWQSWTPAQRQTHKAWLDVIATA